MQTALSTITGIVALLFYLANPKNKINMWFSSGVFFFWVGKAADAMSKEIIPLLESIFGDLHKFALFFEPINSVCTWVIYTLAMPTMLIAVLYFGSVDKTYPNLMRLKFTLYIPGLVLSFFFWPWQHGFYQKTSPEFWLAYAVYNFCFGIAVAFMATRGYRFEKKTSAKKQKRRVALVFLPPLFFWVVSLFVPHLIFMPPYSESIIFGIYKLNFFILLIAVMIFIYFAFKDGFMGIKLVGQKYNWHDNMDLINTSLEYTNHVFKQQVPTMELCIKQLKDYYISSDSNKEVVERLNILSRSILNLKDFVDRIKRHSQIIQLEEEPCKLAGLLADAASVTKESGIPICIDIPDNLFLICDRVHMKEVFTNIITNAVEAIHENGVIEITGTHEKSKYRLMIKDNGEGIDPEILNSIFMPHFTTKNSKEKNFGLGLYYCKNVIVAHGGRILAKSIKGKGTTMILTFLSARVNMATSID